MSQELSGNPSQSFEAKAEVIQGLMASAENFSRAAMDLHVQHAAAKATVEQARAQLAAHLATLEVSLRKHEMEVQVFATAIREIAANQQMIRDVIIQQKITPSPGMLEALCTLSQQSTVALKALVGE